MYFYCLRKHNLPLLILNLGLDVVNSIRGFDLQRYCLAGESLYEDLHVDQ